MAPQTYSSDLEGCRVEAFLMFVIGMATVGLVIVLMIVK